jgi:Uma2 family endonuclease
MPLKIPLRRYTVDEVRAFPPDGCRYELVDGVLLVTPQAAHDHQVVATRLTVEIARYLGPTEPAVVVGPGEIEIQASLHLEPDILVHPARFGPDVPWTKITHWWLAVEVSGKASRRYDRDYRRDAYLAVGVREVWLVDLEEQCVLVSRQQEPRDEWHADQLVWQPPEMTQPLDLDLRAVFDGLR